MSDDYAPPTKRLKLFTPKASQPNAKYARKRNKRPRFVLPRRILSATRRLSNPRHFFRKRKIATPPSIYNLNNHVFMEVLDFLSLDDLCNLADTSEHMRQLAEEAFCWRARNGLTFYRDGNVDIVQLNRIFFKFGHLLSSVHISLGR